MNTFDIVSHSDNGSLAVVSDNGTRYEYSGATARDIEQIRKLIKRKDYAHGWQYLKSLRLFSIQKPGGKEERVSENIFEHLLESELFKPNSSAEVRKRRPKPKAQKGDRVRLTYSIAARIAGGQMRFKQGQEAVVSRSPWWNKDQGSYWYYCTVPGVDGNVTLFDDEFEKIE